eukprot:scaffold2126_cov417-Prasinococcus_capsulatus_cf.AAC.4
MQSATLGPTPLSCMSSSRACLYLPYSAFSDIGTVSDAAISPCVSSSYSTERVSRTIRIGTITSNKQQLTGMARLWSHSSPPKRPRDAMALTSRGARNPKPISRSRDSPRCSLVSAYSSVGDTGVRELALV